MPIAGQETAHPLLYPYSESVTAGHLKALWSAIERSRIQFLFKPIFDSIHRKESESGNLAPPDQFQGGEEDQLAAFFDNDTLCTTNG